jgi:hypothetical protein
VGGRSLRFWCPVSIFCGRGPVLYFEVPADRSAPLRAEVAELADAQASGACGRKVVEVQILSSAPIIKNPKNSI